MLMAGIYGELAVNLKHNESLEPNRTARMDPSSADVHLDTKAIAKLVSEVRTRVNEYTRPSRRRANCCQLISTL